MRQHYHRSALSTAVTRASVQQHSIHPFKALIAAAGLLAGSFAAVPVFAQEGASEEIVITGSRIVRRDFEAASPIVTVGQETFEQISTVGVESALNRLPQFVPGQSQFSSGAFVANAFSTPGIASLNLRGLGSNRNLILVDGRRAQPSNALLVVDVNSIPAAAIQNVEVISGGASATYGADAIGGVVNFKLKNDFEGLSVSMQTSALEEGGGEETRFSTLFGGNLEGGRGNIMLGIDYTTRQEVAQADLDFYTNAWSDTGTDGGGLPHARYRRSTSNAPNQAGNDAVFGAGVLTAGHDEGYFFNPAPAGSSAADVTLFTNGDQTGLVGYTGPIDLENKLYLTPGEPQRLRNNNTYLWASAPMDRYSLFGRADFDITESMSLYGQVNYVHSEVQTRAAYARAEGLWDADIPRDGRALPPELETLLDSRPTPGADWALETTFDFFGEPRGSENETNLFQVMVGLEGMIGDSDWTYDAYISHGNTTILAQNNGNVSVSRWRDIVTAPNFGQGYSASADGAFGLTCTSGIPVFKNFEMSQDCIDALVAPLKTLTTIDQDIMEVNLQGRVMDLPAGEVRAAVGASTRENSFLYEPDTLADAQSVIDRPVGLFSTNGTGGETEVKELYGEALIPLLANVPGVEFLSLEIGARYSDYDTAGEIWTYKSLLDWRVNESVRLRGGYQLANRAPNVAELFLGPSQSVVGFTGGDPCLSNTSNEWGNVASNPNRAQVQALCGTIINNSDNDTSNDNMTDYHMDPLQIVGPFTRQFAFERAEQVGNADLQNEEAETLTAGVVLNIGELTAAIDYYSVEITDAIGPTSAYFIYFKCLNGDGSNPTYAYNDYCSQITRYTTDGYRANVRTPYDNVGVIETSGVDVQLDWSRDIAGGTLALNSVLSYLIEYNSQDEATAPVVESTGTLDNGGQFDYRLTANASYSMDNWTVGMNYRFLPSIENAAYARDPQTPLHGANDYQVFDLFGRYRLNDTMTLRGGIDNLLDEPPEFIGAEPQIDNARGSTSTGYYDILGRRYYVAFELAF